jgi:predicted transcriptional regulator
MTWQTTLRTELETLQKKSFDVQKLTVEGLIKRKEQVAAYTKPDNYEFLNEAKRQIEDISGRTWDNGQEIQETNRRKVMIATFRTKVEAYGLNHISLFVYKTMLYSVNDDMIYFRGAKALADECMLGIATVYKHLDKLRNAKLIQTVKQGFNINGWGSNASIKLLG